MYYAKQSKSDKHKYSTYDLTFVWNLRNKTDEHREREKNMIKTERETNHKRLNTKNKYGCWRGVV